MSTHRLVAIACGVIVLICLFVAVERYQTNAGNVEAMRQMGNGLMPGLSTMEAATPTATKYALLFAALAGIGGVIALATDQSRASSGDRRRH